MYVAAAAAAATLCSTVTPIPAILRQAGTQLSGEVMGGLGIQRHGNMAALS